MTGLGGESGRQRWAQLLDDVLAPDPSPAGRLTIHCQPIVGLEDATVVGYEALARFEKHSPAAFFAAAELLGRRAELEALALREALRLRENLPPDCFLTVNVSPDLATGPELIAELTALPDLSRVVVELTENATVADPTELLALRALIVQRGGLLALDDAGSGYSGLAQIATLRPHLIKVDRSLVRDADADEVKLALIEMLGELAGRLDAWLLVEGVETWSELAAFARLRVPLVQGHLLGRPAAPWSGITPATRQAVRQLVPRVRLVELVTSLVETVPMLPMLPSAAPEVAPTIPDNGCGHSTGHSTVGGPPADSLAVEVDAHQRPVAVLLPSAYRRDPHAGPLRVPVSLRVRPTDELTQVAQRVLARPAGERFDPIVVVDDRGALIGLVRVERILGRLAEPPP